ncbi:MAG: MBL fold metallo-hydrolase [Acidimicrobiia bacterium]|nr:MBL fold metallo-hydrolase [Acidimicrobiia bacterium]
MWQIGELTVRKLVEKGATWPGTVLLPDAVPEALLAHGHLRPDFVSEDGRIFISFHSFLVEVGDRRIVVDTCAGNDKPRERPFGYLSTDYLERMTAAGFGPDDVDTVICTHLHVDHVGWNTRLVDGRWVPTFPNARYVFVRGECEYWAVNKTENSGGGAIFEDSVQPVIDAGLADLVEPGAEVAPGVTLELTPGHTPGHCAVRLRSGGQEGVITGDLIHHPVQVEHPRWPCGADWDPAQGSATREAFVAEQGSAATLVLGTHFAGSSAGRVVASGEGWRWSPLG